MAKKVAILGSTGSIGKSALDVIDKLHGDVRVWGLSANRNFRDLARQAHKYDAQYVSLSDADAERSLRETADDLACKLLPKQDFEQLAAAEADIILVAVVGAAGLTGALAAARSGRRLALANKESLVCAGQLIMEAARRSGAEVVPVDSEHSAIFQAVHSGKAEEILRIVITASGGPFLDRDGGLFDDITVEETLAHPTWSMGRKITVDSATMVNKAFEVVEARWLFDMPPERISVLVHPESVVHSLVEFADRSLIAQLSVPDMRLPIQYAFTYPRRLECPIDRLDLASVGTLTFRAPDGDKFPCLDIGFEVAREGGTSGAVFNAANEVAVAAFLGGRLKFSGIHGLIRRVLDAHETRPADNLETILEADRRAREEAEKCL